MADVSKIRFGILLPHIFEIPSVSKRITWYFDQNPQILIKKPSLFQMKMFEILVFLHIEFEILVLSNKIPSTSKTFNFN